jgi:DNA replication protein DnaC
MLAAGLCYEAATKGYRAYFRTMEELTGMLKTKDFARSAKAEYKRLLKADLIVMDDIMLFRVEKSEAVALFNFIKQLYEKTSFMMTTNKKPAQCAQMSGDAVLATALLDRLLYQCEVMSLSGKSYRRQNRKRFLATKKKTIHIFFFRSALLVTKNLCILVAKSSAFLLGKILYS